MRRGTRISRDVRLAGAAIMTLAFAATANAQSASGRQDRLALMAQSATLTGTDGGWGGSALWLHNFNADVILGLGGEHQSIGDARWNFGKLTFNYGFGQASERTSLYLEANEGSGHDKVHHYDYSIEAVGLYQAITRQWIIQLEDRRIDVDTVKGNLPKLGVQYWWSPTLATSVAYAYSQDVHLDTQLLTARVDASAKNVNFFAGLANGPAAPIVTNNIVVPIGPYPSVVLHEYYVGIGRTFSRADITTVLDYSKLGSSNHWTLTFSAMLHKRTGVAR
jgi:hypothetical protein